MCPAEAGAAPRAYKSLTFAGRNPPAAVTSGRPISPGLFGRAGKPGGGGAASCRFEAKFNRMKNESLSFKLIALVIIAGVIAAFLDTSSSAKSTAPAAPALASTATGQTE